MSVGVICYGYTCDCGKRIVAYRFGCTFPDSIADPIPSGVTLACPCCHVVRQVPISEIPSLERWKEVPVGENSD